MINDESLKNKEEKKKKREVEPIRILATCNRKRIRET